MCIVDLLGPTQADFDNFDHRYKPNVELYRLARMCTTLRNVCLPKLYEICSVTGSRNLWRSLNIVRTLIARPELARAVKRLIFDAGFYVDARHFPRSSVVLSALDSALFRQVLIGAAPTYINVDAMQANTKLSEAECDLLGEYVACVALALVPNITSAIFSSRRLSIGRYVGIGAFRPGYFPRLEAFSIQEDQAGMDIDFDHAQGILRFSAPNLRRLIRWSIGSLSISVYPTITQLVLICSRLTNADMALLPRAFPRLEQFTYVDGGTDSLPFYPTESAVSARFLHEAVLGLRRTLKHLELGAHEADLLGEDDALENRFLESLASMEVLETLRLPTYFIFGDDDDTEQQSGDSMEVQPIFHTDLTQFLPRSIRSFYMEDAQQHTVVDILALAQVVPSKFPNLRHVTFTDLPPSSDVVVGEAFEKCGVKFSFEDVDINEYECDYTNDGDFPFGKNFTYYH